MSLSYEEASTLLEDNDWDSLLQKDQVGYFEFHVKYGLAITFSSSKFNGK